MTRRILGPIGGPIIFFLVAALVFSGLGWVTHSAIGVEQAQREAAARAELGNNLRVALWRLDGRMLPALGVEDSRPYFHYSPPDPAATPLLVATLPDWMKLHFQLDPTTGWCSPQVLDATTAQRVREAWDEVETQNLSSDRATALRDLKLRCPANNALAWFAATEHALPDDSPSLGTPVTIGESHLPGAAAQTTNVPQPAAPEGNPGPSAGSGNAATGHASSDCYTIFGWELCPRNDALNNTIRPQDANQQALQQKKLIENPQNALTNSVVPGSQLGGRGGRMGQKDGNSGRQQSDFTRAGVIDRALKEAKQAAELPPLKGQQGAYNNNYLPLIDQKNSAYGAVGGGGKFAAPLTGNSAAVPGGPGGTVPNSSQNVPGISSRDEKSKEAGGSFFDKYVDDFANRNRVELAARAALEVSGWIARPYEIRTRRVSGVTEKDNTPTTSPLPPPGEERLPVLTQPTAIHLGSMRPHWITAPDGSDMLVLVRAANIDGKTVYQGVVVDWDKLESSLKDEVKDLFPEAKLVPVKDTSTVFPDRAMTALPVQLDPGPEAPLAPAGWTPLRVGLTLSWIAAIIAFAAVGFAGWSLMDLAERRIRFVSAVTHELRTPLTSLRLYLDMLVSGMIQDEDKRREYLGTLAIESDRLHRLVDNVLDFARLEKRKKNGDIRPVRVNELTDQLRQTWTDRVAQDGKELVVISTLADEHEVNTDPAMIQQILGNLVDNARKYSHDAADKRIWVWVKPGAGRAVVFEVEDRGPGVPAGERKSIFKPFRRGRQTVSTGGAGLGLSLAKSWAEVLGARLTYRTAECGTGACFRLELPGS